MARTFTVAQIADRIRELIDAEQMRALSPDELRRRISSSYARYYAKLVGCGLGFPTEVTQSITASGDTYALPADHFSTQRVDYFNGTLWIPLWEVDIRELHNVQYSNFGGYSFCYRLAGPSLILYPPPAVGGTYRHIYCPAPVDLTLDTQTLDGVCGWEEAVILDAAIHAVMKWEGETADLRAERQALDERIDAEVQMRSLNKAKRIVINRRYHWDRGYEFDADVRDAADWWPWR